MEDIKVQAASALAAVTPIVVDEDAMLDRTVRTEPMVVKQMSLPSRKEALLARVYDGVDRIPVEDEAYSMGLERVSKVIARLEPKEVKMDCNITAMGILAMFPGVVEK
jgi:hypothetical protein